MDVFGPTFLDLANHLSVGVGAVSAMFGVAAIGSIFGSGISGILLDGLEELSFLILSVTIFIAAISKFNMHRFEKG